MHDTNEPRAPGQPGRVERGGRLPQGPRPGGGQLRGHVRAVPEEGVLAGGHQRGGGQGGQGGGAAAAARGQGENER